MSGLEIFGLVAGVFISVSMGRVAAKLHAIPADTELSRAVVGSIFWVVFGTAIGGALLIVGIILSVPALAIGGAALAVAGFVALPIVGRRWQREAAAITARATAETQRGG